MGSSETIMELEVEVSDIMKDIRKRVEDVFDKYTDDDRNIPKLPLFDDLMKSNRLHYDTSRVLTECNDEILAVKVRISIIQKGLRNIENITASSKSDYTLIASFKSTIKKYREELDSYKFDLIDLLKNSNNKLRVLESVSFYNGEV